MRLEDPHASDQDLVRAADGELSGRRAAEIRAHLDECWMCRARMRELQDAAADFVRARHGSRDSLLPPPDGAKALLKARMEEIIASSEPPFWQRVLPPVLQQRVLAIASVLALSLLGIVALRSGRPAGELSKAARLEPRAIPDPQLTPGVALPVTRDDVCAAGMTESAHIVPTTVALEVFAAYGIAEPKPRAYEVDYLITPALGGSDNIRNFWPQPYAAAWNANLKDALEDHLYHLVCAGKLDLRTAQRDISRDWISAYKKYFGTDKPLPEHSGFLRDRPWE